MELILRSAEVSIPQAIENLEQLKAEIAPKMEYYRSLVVTEESIRSAKADKAKLNKLKKAIDDQRIAVKKQCLAPYEALEKECKELETLIVAPIAAIDAQIKAFEEIEKNKKYEEFQTYFNEINNCDYIRLEQIINPKWANKGESTEKLKKEITDSLIRINAEHLELKELYKDSPFWTAVERLFKERLEKSPALVYAVQLQADYEKEQKKKLLEAEKNVQEAAANVSDENDPVMQQKEQTADRLESEQIISGTFKVSCTKSQLIMLRDFMKSKKIKFEIVKE